MPFMDRWKLKVRRLLFLPKDDVLSLIGTDRAGGIGKVIIYNSLSLSSHDLHFFLNFAVLRIAATQDSFVTIKSLKDAIFGAKHGHTWFESNASGSYVIDIMDQVALEYCSVMVWSI